MEFKKFTEGYFTSIEQTLMIVMSVEEGPFQRSISEKFISGSKKLFMVEGIIEGTENVCHISLNNSFQHRCWKRQE